MSMIVRFVYNVTPLSPDSAILYFTVYLSFLGFFRMFIRIQCTICTVHDTYQLTNQQFPFLYFQYW